ncbi:hypothetical protein PROFUN_11448 [Planoprotostelium fungivorum]|uniref:G-protein coupled receptors family 1 profile domain-containing protein n=1 Tax=Planoprotostelium fungivorum TaxID=1890364 RepID=A0A2P6N4W3_9EUKA|nr:hypothetical protein PROFUN_11448 [Planoprotostelium fungivorum]
MIPVIGLMALWFIMIIADGQTLRVSAAWCYDYGPLKGFDCDMLMFIMVVLVDAAMFLVSTILLGILILRKKRVFERYMQLDEEDDLPISMKRTGRSTSAKKSSKFSKFTRK